MSYGMRRNRHRHRRTRLILTLVVLPTCVWSQSNPAWTANIFPLPGSQECRSTSSRLCDPDGILIDIERQRVVKRIEELEVKSKLQCASSSSESNVQMVVALVDRMDLNLIEVPSGDNREERTAQALAVELHNLWGVGSVTECGGTGLLIFFSIRDRAFFVSRGKALESSLTDKRIDRVMDSIKPYLRDQNYARAVLNALGELDKYLTAGPPTREELYHDMLETLLPLSLFTFMLAMVGFKGCLQHRDARAYARVQTQLSQLDRDRAQALQGRYQCVSCPICLENFETAADGCPPTKGSDGLPLKLLRCGHVFDETCWSEWVSSGTGNIRRCPICQQDVGSSSSYEFDPQHPDHQERQPVAEDDNRVFRQFHRERNFRLLRLGMQYPRFVRHDLIQRWTDTRYEGSLVQDPAFVRSNPQYQSSTRGGGTRSGMSSSFGGGSSGGGRGGSW